MKPLRASPFLDNKVCAEAKSQLLTFFSSLSLILATTITVSGVSCEDAQHWKILQECEAGETANSSFFSWGECIFPAGPPRETLIKTLFSSRKKKKEFCTAFLHFPQVTKNKSHSAAGSLVVE